MALDVVALGAMVGLDSGEWCMWRVAHVGAGWTVVHEKKISVIDGGNGRRET